MRRIVLLLSALALLAGCSGPSGDAPADGAGATPDGTPGATEAGGEQAPAPAVPFNQTFPFQVTYASPAQGGGTNAAVKNCVMFGAGSYREGKAVLQWTPGPTSEELELVVHPLTGPQDALRVTGPSPIEIPFEFGDSRQLAFSVQSAPTGAVAQQDVELTISFLSDDDREGRLVTCAF